MGYADTQLLYKNDPTDSRNRRISIILLNEKVAKTSKQQTEITPIITTTVPVTSSALKTTTTPPAVSRQEQKKSLMEPIKWSSLEDLLNSTSL